MPRCSILWTLLGVINYALAQAPGWRMVDRFYGFRYEISGSKILNIGFENAIQQKADDLGCFGWVQKTQKATLVGEARCGKLNGPVFEEWLKAGYSPAIIERVQIKIYDDTKIRLHFAYFKILDDDRDTCFLDAPHMCSDVNRAEHTGAVSDEL